MSAPMVDLFIPCLVETFLPDVGLAVADCLRVAGCEVRFDERQTCCGQVFLNSGRVQDAARLARSFVRRFANVEVVVGPSWSCVSTIRDRYGEILGDPGLVREWEALKPRIFELVDYLTRERGVRRWPGRFREGGAAGAHAVLHWSCHMPRDEAIRRAAEDLIGSVDGLVLEPRPPDECCGFGGVFMVMWREVSAAMGRRRFQTLTRGGPDLVVLGEPGCLLQLRSVSMDGVRVSHIAEVLAGAARGTA